MCLKRQSSCLTSTFGAEFPSLKKAVEEAAVIRYYCRSFGMRITKPTVIYEDSMSVVMNCTIPGSKLSHKSMTLLYHFARGYAYGKVVEIRKIGISENISNDMTKELDSSAFNNCILSVITN